MSAKENQTANSEQTTMANNGEGGKRKRTKDPNAPKRPMLVVLDLRLCT